MREQQAEREEQVEEVWSSSELEEDPVSSDGYGLEEENDEDSLQASAHRLVTRSTPKKLVSRPKRKAYMSKGFGPGDSSRKQSKGHR